MKTMPKPSYEDWEKEVQRLKQTVDEMRAD